MRSDEKSVPDPSLDLEERVRVAKRLRDLFRIERTVYRLFSVLVVVIVGLVFISFLRGLSRGDHTPYKELILLVSAGTTVLGYSSYRSIRLDNRLATIINSMSSSELDKAIANALAGRNSDGETKAG